MDNIVYLSPNFKRAEAACGCGCGFGMNDGDVSPELLSLLEMVRLDVNRLIRVNSWCRCKYYNHAVGGVPDSAHTRGTAVDIAVYGGEDRHAVVEAALVHGAQGVGVASSFVHIDVDQLLPRPSLWIY